jgi:replicative DNA helicase
MTSTISSQQLAVPPQNLEAERSVPGAALLDEHYLDSMVLETGLSEHDFYRPQHGLVFSAMHELHDAGEPIDPLTVTSKLAERGKLDEAGGGSYVDELAGWVPAAGHAVAYAKIVRDHAQARALLRATYDVQALISEHGRRGEELLEEAERLVFSLRAGALGKRTRLLEDAVADELDRLERASRDGREIPGLSTGMTGLDRIIGGLQSGRLYILAARPSMGKSMLALQVSRHAAFLERRPALFASLEMSDSETAQRHLAAEADVDPEQLHLGNIREGDWPALLGAVQRTARAPLHLLDDGDLTLSRLRAHARRLATRPDGLGLVTVDYLQLMRAEKPSGNRVEDVSEFSRGLKRLARELDCPVLAISQLSRNVDSDPTSAPSSQTCANRAKSRPMPTACSCSTETTTTTPTQSARARWTSSSARTAKADSDRSQHESTVGSASVSSDRYKAMRCDDEVNSVSRPATAAER